MQTFLPYNDYYKSAKVLDRQRLGKQRVEVLQLLNSIRKIKNGEPIRGWKNHPCRKMWQNYSNALVEYGQAVCKAWKERGYKDTCYEKITAHYDNKNQTITPPFMGNNIFHESHRSMLTQKNSSWYKKLWPSTPDNLEYYWPEESPTHPSPEGPSNRDR